VPDVPLYAPHYAVAPDKTKSKPAAPRKEGFKVLDALSKDTDFEDGPITVPDLTGQPLLKAVDEIDRLGLDSDSEGNGKVIGQNPPAGAHVRPGTLIQLRLSLR